MKPEWTRRRVAAVRWTALGLVGAGVCVAIVAAPLALGSPTPTTGGITEAIAAAPSATPDAETRPVPTDTTPRLSDLPANPRALILGDSFTAGYGATSSSANWAAIAAGSLRWQATIDGVGGTGFTKTTSTDGTDGLGFRQRLLAQARTGATYDVIVIQGGLNDWRASTEAEAEAVGQVVRTARMQWPEAVVVVFGPAEPIAAGTARLVHLPAIRAASVEAGAVFIDPSSPTPWITTGNSDLLDLGDGLHLNDAGYGYLAARFVTAVLTAQSAE
ncbi:SGNH/GDSL hydrolase family protein [Agromyces sp. Marseille-Q5079]|uniref:SGNH/GDSL hydrolase family protein n=1 Tax=Agromyces sp. Marseille-Q5079 TaxID=3439059 RepID=UPI003D9C7EB2